jgi:hypothetical protein
VQFVALIMAIIGVFYAFLGEVSTFAVFTCLWLLFSVIAHNLKT